MNKLAKYLIAAGSVKAGPAKNKNIIKRIFHFFTIKKNKRSVI